MSHADRQIQAAFTKLVVALRNCFSNSPNKNAHIFLLLVKEKHVNTSRNAGSRFGALGERPALPSLKRKKHLPSSVEI